MRADSLVPLRKPFAWLERLGGALTGARPGGWRWAAVLAAVAWIAYAIHWPLADKVIPWDAKDFYYPALRALAAARAAGDSGFWTSFLYGGHAAVADPQSWLFVPGFRLLAELNDAPSMILTDQVQLLHLLAGGLGVLMLLRALAYRPAAGLLAALVFMFGGVAASRLQHSLMTVSYAYLPWALLLLERALHSTRLRRRLAASAGFGLVAGLMAVGRDQTAFLNCWLLIGAALWWLAQHGRAEGLPAAARRAATLLPALVIGSAIVIVPVLLTLDALAGSTRPDIGFELAAHGSQQPASLLTLLAPNLFGNLDAGSYWGPGQLPWMDLAPFGNDWTDETTNYLYIGALPLTLLFAAFAMRGVWPRASGLFAAGLACALLYALGAHTPAFRLFYDWLPGADFYRRPNDAAFAVNALLALLAGAALQKWIVGEAGWSRARLAAVAALLLIAIAGAAWLALRFGHVRETVISLLLGLVFLLAAIALLRWRGRGFGIVVLAICSLTAADLVAHNAAAPFNAHPQANFDAHGPAGERLARAIAARVGNPNNPYRAEIFGLGGDWQNAPMIHGIEQTLGYNPLRQSDYAEATGARQNSHDHRRQLTDLFTGYDSPLARLLGIKLVVTGQPIQSVLPAAAIRSLHFVGDVEDAHLYENSGALPRVMVVERAEPDDGQPLPFDPERRVLIDDLPAPVGVAGAAPAGTARILARDTDDMRIAVSLERPAYLVVNDLYHPSWTAKDETGRDLPILRANHLFRAVYLPAGAHVVEMSFDPLSWRELLETLQRLLADG